MNRTLILATAALAALSLAACNKAGNGASNPPSAVTPQEKAETPDAHPSATIPTPANEASAPDFVAKAAASDMFEVAAAKVAIAKSSNADVKAFAHMMETAHTATTKALKAAIKDSGRTDLVPPAALPTDLQNKLDDLNKADAASFDKTYIGQQVDAHQAALDLMQRYAKDGDVAQIKAFAADTAPHVQEHLTKAKGIKDALK